MYTMKEVCQKTNMTYEGLKFYCNEGLVPNVKRNKNNYRIFDDDDVAWIESLNCLKRCGMGIQDMKKYLALCQQGPSSIPERKQILSNRKTALLEQIAELKESIEYIDWKQQFYDDILSGKREYVSKLAKTEGYNLKSR